jgi:peptidoglycan/xylan/chitin deacetylase (PgdA/CDA1 family)
LLSRELILNFHGIGTPHADAEAGERLFWLSRPSFADILDQILDRPADADTRIKITFDDGNESDALVALPELASRGLTATFFLCAGRIGRRFYLDKAMIKDLLDAGMHIGSHGMHHRNWRDLDAKNLDVEITDARKMLEDCTKTEITLVAIPFGSYNRRVLKRLNQEQWGCIYTSDGGIVRADAKVKSRQTMRTCEEDVLNQMLRPSPIGERLSRTVSKLYKSWR